MAKTLYFNITSGISGDMVVGALLDLTGDSDHFLSELKKLGLQGFSITIKKASKKGISATKFDVQCKKENQHRHISDIFRIIDGSKLNSRVKKLSKDIFLTLGKAEAAVHGIALEEVHFHEVGAVDSIIDIVGAAILIDKIRAEHICCNQAVFGRGRINFSHGTTTLPVPAVKEILRGIPYAQLNINHELTTPTGAAIIKTLCEEFREAELCNARKGFGAGTRDLIIPNVLEAQLGEMMQEKNVLLQTNIDDMNPELFPYVIDQLMKTGAIDAFIQPIIMKKNRIGGLLSVLCKEEDREKMVELIFAETTTFGIRVSDIGKERLEREFKKVRTRHGIVDVKIGKWKGKVMSAKPEYECCKKIAIKKKVPLKEVYEEAKRALNKTIIYPDHHD